MDSNDPLCIHIPESSLYEMEIIEGNVSRIYGWLKKKRELSEKILSNFIKFL
jgi:hypothetical protein